MVITWLLLGAEMIEILCCQLFVFVGLLVITKWGIIS